MEKREHPHRPFIVTLAAALVILGLAGGAFAADPPVKITIAVTGDPAPGATVTARATVTINDGSTLQGIQWIQVGGVHATLANTATDTVTITLPDRKTFREDLIEVLEEKPVTDDKLPVYVPARTAYEGGLQNRFGIAAVSPHARIDAAAIRFNVKVTTTSGTYDNAASVAANVPWQDAIGTRNVPIHLPVLLHAKTQATYDWTLEKPVGSSAALLDAKTQNPEFTPDVPGTYKLTITDLESAKPVTFDVHAGTWTGIVTGQDASGRPIPDPACMTCHVKNTPHFDLFTPWARSGHAEIFTQNVNNPAGHYTSNCVSCHAVGVSAKAQNNGIDDASDWSAFLSTDLLTHGAVDNWTKILQQFPNSARMANIQCENCHGPQQSAAHMKKDGSRKSLSSDVCGTCHGEPLRHGRFQQWQLSSHANYETAVAEGTDPSCGKCHSAQGFVAWQNKNFSTANLTVTWTTDEVHPQTCATCHDPHDVGSTSGGPTTNAKVRVAGNTPDLMSGFKATNVGTGAICMTCHNGRRGIRNDSNFSLADGTRAPHAGPQADVIMGQNMYFVKTGTRSNHSNIQDTCVTCHMESTNPPAALANKNADGTYGGTNHTFFANPDICSKCHSSITLESVQHPVESKLDALKVQIESAIKNVMLTQIRAGNTIDIGGTKVNSVSEIVAVEFIESHGRQGVNVDLRSLTDVHDLSLASVKVLRPGGSSVDLYSVADPSLAKAGWNYFMVHSDKSKGAHNPAFVNAALDVSLFAVTAVNTAMTTPTTAAPGGSASLGGGLGNGAGAVSCTTPYVYWSEIAGHLPGNAGSEWRTDLVARNLDSTNASVKFILHQAGGTNLERTSTIDGRAQKAFEDLTAEMGGESNAGALEICSDRPLLVASRVFNKDTVGTFGQNLDGRVADLGYGAGQTVNLIGLRQKTDAFRSNLVITNGGKTEAEVAIILYDSTGKSLAAYNLVIPAGTARQDNEPFRYRANSPDVEWGFATVTVVKGTNVLATASMIDNKTNDPTTIPAKQ